MSQFVVLQGVNYLQEYLCHQRINDDVIEQIVKGYVFGWPDFIFLLVMIILFQLFAAHPK